MTDEALIDERSLREALRPLRPEPGSFEDAVRKKLAEREARLARIERSPFLRQAAALLPPGIAPMMPVAAAGKKIFAQVTATLFAMPVLVLVMTGVTFVAALSSLRRLDASHVDENAQLRRAQGWWQAHPLGVLLVVGLFMVLGYTGSLDLLLALVLVSMLSLTWVLHRLSAAGFAGRRQVGMFCGYLIFMLTMGVSPARSLLGGDFAELQGFLLYVLLFTSGICCYLLAIPAGGDPKTGLTRPAMLLITLPLLGVVVFLQIWGWNPRVVGMTRAELVEYVETTAPSRDDSSWRELREIALWLERTGSEEPRLLPAWTEFRDAFNAGADLSNFVLGDAADLGWIEDEDWDTILDTGRVQRLLEQRGKITFLTQARALLHGLVSTGALTDEQRDRLSWRLRITWNEVGEFAQLETLREVVRDLALLGRLDRSGSLREQVHAALLEAWITGEVERATDVGGFAGHYRKSKGYATSRAAGHAVALMEDFGVPAAIDLELVHDYLRSEAERSRRRGISSSDALDALALARFEHAFGDSLAPEQEPAWWRFVLDWRLTIGFGLLAGLCVYATLRAPEA